jgi:NAD(P)-dependent dehydrogenase (short-subunit alcohol dehydrogenase family)
VLALSTYGGQATHPGASLYHASKWGLEGFFDSLASEVATFNIGVTIVEPGGARTAFRKTAGAEMGTVDDAYKDTPIGGCDSIFRTLRLSLLAIRRRWSRS